MTVHPNFSKPSTVGHRQYEALRAFFVDQLTAVQAADRFGYSRYAFYSLVRDFKKNLAQGSADPFFSVVKTGRKPMDSSGEGNRSWMSLTVSRQTNGKKSM